MTITLSTPSGTEFGLEPRLELYETEDFMGRTAYGLAIGLYRVGRLPWESEEDYEEEKDYAYLTLTVNLGFISPLNCAYADINNCGTYAMQAFAALAPEGKCRDTGFSRKSGFVDYPLWEFSEGFLEEIGPGNYALYKANRRELMP